MIMQTPTINSLRETYIPQVVSYQNQQGQKNL